MASLNPCCSGRWSRTLSKEQFDKMATRVLILVVVEDGLVLQAAGTEYQLADGNVLILVVVEDGLVQLVMKKLVYTKS